MAEPAPEAVADPERPRPERPAPGRRETDPVAVPLTAGQPEPEPAVVTVPPIAPVPTAAAPEPAAGAGAGAGAGGLLRRAAGFVPAGTHLVIGGTLLLGLASYVQIAAAGHALGAHPRAAVSQLWSLVMTVSLGLFFPVEQELTRLVAARAVRGEGVRPVLVRGAVLTVGLLALLCGVLAGAAGPLARRFFAGDTQLVWAFGAALVGMGLVYVTRGVLAGLGRFGAYGISLGLDGVVRIAAALGLLAAGVHRPLPYALVLAVAPLLAMVGTLRPVLRGSAPGPHLPWPELLRDMGLLMGGTVLAQVVVNAPVVTLALISPGDADLTFAVLSAAVLCRVPLFVFGSLQPTLMTGLSATATAGDRVGFRRTLARTCAVIGALGLLGGVPAVLVGGWLIRTFLGAPDVLHRVDFLLFAAGTAAYMLALVLGQALVASGRHLAQFLGWSAGVLALVGTVFIPGAVSVRVECAYFSGSLVTALAMLAVLRLRSGAAARTAGVREPGDGIAVDTPGS